MSASISGGALDRQTTTWVAGLGQDMADKLAEGRPLRVKLGLDRGMSGQLDGPSSYFMKSPFHQHNDDVAYRLVEEFAAGQEATA